jgi:hypothetical protein
LDLVLWSIRDFFLLKKDKEEQQREKGQKNIKKTKRSKTEYILLDLTEKKLEGTQYADTKGDKWLTL